MAAKGRVISIVFSGLYRSLATDIGGSTAHGFYHNVTGKVRSKTYHFFNNHHTNVHMQISRKLRRG